MKLVVLLLGLITLVGGLYSGDVALGVKATILLVGCIIMDKIDEVSK